MTPDKMVESARAQSLALCSDPEWSAALDAAEIRYRLKWARSRSRFWYYDRASRQPTAEYPDWRSPWLPWFGNDEYGRKTLVLPVPFLGEIVWAFWTWTCPEAHWIRDRTWRYEHEEEDTA